MPVIVRTPRGPIVVEAGPFVERVKEAAQQAGLSKFRVFVGMVEVSPDNPPATLEEGTDITLFPYDVGA